MTNSCRCAWCEDPRKADTSVKHLVETCGLAVIHVEAPHPSITYTIGLSANFKHPEIIIFGLPSMLAHPLLSACAEMIKSGHIFAPESVHDEFCEDAKIAFRQVVGEQAEKYMGICHGFYGQLPPVMQMVWADPNGHFPWDGEFSELYRDYQMPLWNTTLLH